MPESPVIPPESFATARLILRKPRAEDAPLIFATYAQDPEVVRYLTFRPHRDLNDTHEAVDRFLEGWRSGKSYCWLIFRRDGEELIGAIAARYPGPPQSTKLFRNCLFCSNSIKADNNEANTYEGL